MAYKVACLVVLCVVVVVVAPYVEEAITCGQAKSTMVPCRGYLTKGGVVSTPCCNGIKGLNALAKTMADRQQACRCLKKAAAAFDINYIFTAMLPGKSGVNIPYKISSSINCSKV